MATHRLAEARATAESIAASQQRSIDTALAEMAASEARSAFSATDIARISVDTVIQVIKGEGVNKKTYLSIRGRDFAADDLLRTVPILRAEAVALAKEVTENAAAILTEIEMNKFVVSDIAGIVGQYLDKPDINS